MYRPKDFIKTAEGLIFAVVADGIENGKVRCFLRYIQLDGHWRKIASDDANRFLGQYYPQYLFHSTELDAHLHAVSGSDVSTYFSPRAILPRLLEQQSEDVVLTDLQNLCVLLQDEGISFKQIGITGSLLLGLQNSKSDIDLVCYDREVFQQLRQGVQSLIARNLCQHLNDQDWLDSYQRRSCELSLEEYIDHERRKHNKAMINHRKFDLSLVAPPRVSAVRRYLKLGKIRLETRVIEDQYAFDYPAEFGLEHPEIASVVSFTATYAGQAQKGEYIQVAGQLEEDELGVKRIVVGSSREAAGEYIKLTGNDIAI